MRSPAPRPPLRETSRDLRNGARARRVESETNCKNLRCGNAVGDGAVGEAERVIGAVEGEGSRCGGGAGCASEFFWFLVFFFGFLWVKAVKFLFFCSSWGKKNSVNGRCDRIHSIQSSPHRPATKLRDLRKTRARGKRLRRNKEVMIEENEALPV